MNSNKMFFNSGLQVILVVAMIFSVTLVSCQEEGEDPDFRNRGVFEAKVNGNSWEPDQITFMVNHANRFQINGLNKSEEDEISFSIEPKEVGVYQIKDEKVSMTYRVYGDGKPDEYKDAPAYIDYISEGEINITKYTEDSIKFTFSGTGEYFNLTEGEVAIKIN